MEHRDTDVLVDYWSRLRRGQIVPDQADIEPRAIKWALPFVFILEADNPGRPVYRLAGTGLCRRFGFELKGTSFLSHWDGPSAAEVCALLRRALDWRCPISLHSSGSNTRAGMIELETILAPISTNGRKPSRFIGMTQVFGERADIFDQPVPIQRLSDWKLINEDDSLPPFDTWQAFFNSTKSKASNEGGVFGSVPR
jgi:hypothetical protein